MQKFFSKGNCIILNKWITLICSQMEHSSMMNEVDPDLLLVLSYGQSPIDNTLKQHSERNIRKISIKTNIRISVEKKIHCKRLCLWWHASISVSYLQSSLARTTIPKPSSNEDRGACGHWPGRLLLTTLMWGLYSNWWKTDSGFLISLFLSATIFTMQISSCSQ